MTLLVDCDRACPLGHNPFGIPQQHIDPSAEADLLALSLVGDLRSLDWD